MKALTKNWTLIVGAILFLALTSYLGSLDYGQSAKASVIQGSEYHATTTTTGTFATENALQTGSGALGSVVITGPAAGVMNFYDATTSDVSKRTGNKATSTILLASFPASAPAGTYTFDEAFYTGLYVSVIGTMPTSTITSR